jgi:GNAT superfamily N-acetyltransferase
MNIHELATYNLSDAVKFHNRLNPRLWDEGEQLKPEVREKLLAIAADFQEFLGISDLEVEDITISGSNAAYSYTPHSDIDLHLVVRQPQQDDEVYQELFNAKKYQYNDMHNIRVKGADVELYVQPADQRHVSLGVYSVLNDQWIDIPRRKRARIDHDVVRHKYEDIKARIESALTDGDSERIAALTDKIKEMRQAGLDAHGEFGAENLAFKMLRTQGLIKQLWDAKADAKDRELSLDERKKKKKKSKVRYGFGGYWYPGTAYAGQDQPAGSEGGGGDGGGDGGGGESIREDAGATPDGVNPTTCMFLNEEHDSESIVREFINDVAKKLQINDLPEIKLHTDPAWSEQTHSFGRYEPDTHTLHVSLTDRHIMDILRTTAHELAHCKQNELAPLPDNAGETGSEWENEAHAVAGIVMRDFADAHPEYFSADDLDEGIGQKIAGAALAGMLAFGSGAQAQTVGQVLGGVTGVANAVQSLKHMGWAGTQEELTQEIKNYSRALGGDPNAQNQSILYRSQRGTGQDATVSRPAPKSAEQSAADFEAYKQDYYKKKAEFDKRFQQNEDASGYIPTKKQARDPRFSTALTVDIKPGEVGRQANKMGLQTDRQGKPALIMKTANLRESQTLEERLRNELAALGQDQERNKIRTNRTGDRLDGLGNQMPLGPETPPKMPDGTIKVDVSDMYDWYKLGQNISNLDSINKDELGKGPPSTVFAFGSEDLENMYSHKLTNLGLKTHDLDEPGEEDIDENFADGKKPGRKGLAKRMGVNTKASVSDLRKTAKNSSGEKQRMAHWLANMKAGRAKNEDINEIARLPKSDAGDFGDKGTLADPAHPVKKKPLPGGSGFTYAVNKPDAENLEIMIFDGDTLAGELDLFYTRDFMKTWRVETVVTDPDYRGRGLGKALYGIALSILKLTIEAGDTQTRHGQQMWLMLNSIPGVSVQGYNMERTGEYKPQRGDNVVDQNKDWTRYTFPVNPGSTSMRSGRRGTGIYTTQASMIAKWGGQ